MQSELHDETTGPDARESAAAGLRRLIELLLCIDADDPGVGTLADRLDRIADLLGDDDLVDSTGDDTEPVSGRRNAFAPPLDIESRPDGSVTANTVFGLAYQGPKGVVHGGISALVLDHVLGRTSAGGQGSVRVAELSVRYHRALPLFTNVVVAGRPVDPDDGPARGLGEITVRGVTSVSAEVIFRDDSQS
jgi:acyl-coenzyme A thioesterase PaaI-like protein